MKCILVGDGLPGNLKTISVYKDLALQIHIDLSLEIL